MITGRSRTRTRYMLKRRAATSAALAARRRMAAQGFLGRYRYKKRRVTGIGQSKVGNSPLFDPPKKAIAVNVDRTARNSRELYQYPLTGGIVSGGDPDQRERNVILLTSVNINGYFDCNTQSTLYLNIAVCGSATLRSTAEIDFFKSYTTSRGIDFNPANLNSTQFHRLPINTDIWRVYWHKRMLLPPTNSQDATGSGVGFDIKEFKKYIKINRTITYDSGAVDSDTPLYIFLWGDRIQDIKGSTAVTGAYFFQCFATVKFRELT